MDTKKKAQTKPTETARKADSSIGYSLKRSGTTYTHSRRKKTVNYKYLLPSSNKSAKNMKSEQPKSLTTLTKNYMKVCRLFKVDYIYCI